MREEHALGEQFVFLQDPDGVLANKLSGTDASYDEFVPGTYVIDKRGKIVFSFADKDYMARASTERVLEELRQIVGS